MKSNLDDARPRVIPKPESSHQFRLFWNELNRERLYKIGVISGDLTPDKGDMIYFADDALENTIFVTLDFHRYAYGSVGVHPQGSAVWSLDLKGRATFTSLTDDVKQLRKRSEGLSTAVVRADLLVMFTKDSTNESAPDGLRNNVFARRGAGITVDAGVDSAPKMIE
jgi:hypothetical protein